jgi:subtilisin family serine protease
MRRVRFALGALLSAGLIILVLNRDDPAPVQSTQVQREAARRERLALPASGAVERFRDASLVEKRETFDAAAGERAVIEIVKTRSKYPYIRVETPFVFDSQAQAWVAQPPIEYVADQVLVELKPGVTEKEFADALQKIEGRIIQKHRADESTLVLVGLPKPTIEAVPNAISRLKKSPALFEIVEPHLVRRASVAPNDPEFYQQWALQTISAPAAWDIETGRSSVVVAVLDSGIDYNHPDLAARVWSNPGEVPGNGIDDDRNGRIDDYRGYNFAYENANIYDDDNHGTFVSGIIGAAGNEAVGMSGVCWNVRIMPVKVIDSYGLLYGFDELRGLDYARTEGAKIINASFGGNYFSSSEASAISRLQNAGVLLVAAAGNQHRNNDLRPVYPASYGHDNIIAVAYSDENDALAPNSNFGPKNVDLAAPGISVFSALPGNDYTYGSGSSFSTPHVVGVAALLKAHYPNKNYAWVKAAILNNADLRPAMAGRMVSGGRLNAYEALIPRVPLADSLDATSLVWTTGGTRGWFGQWLSTSDGFDAARCGNIWDNQSSWVQTTVLGPGRLSFYWRVSSEADMDYLRFMVDGVQEAYLSGEIDWNQMTLDLPAGTHTLRWTYSKDGGGSSGEDKGWLDQVSFIRDARGPVIRITAPTGTNLYATDVQLEGTCSDVLGVATLECQVINGSGAGPWLTPNTSDNFATWQVQLSNLALSTNLVRFRAVDVLNQVTLLSRTYVVLSPLTVNIGGCGSVSKNFGGTTWQEAGKTLTIRAIPCEGHLFTHWSGDIPSSNSVLRFVMQPNLTLQANFEINPFGPVAGSYNGLFHEAGGVLHESSGLFQMTLTDTGVFSGSIVCDGATNVFNSRFDPVSGANSFAVPRAGKSSLQLSLQLDFNDQLTGQIGNGVWIADLLADRVVFNATNPAPFAGNYALVFPGAVDFTASPGGHGFATAIVNGKGRVSLDGRMGDHARVLQTIFVSKNGDWPFYVPLYANRGSTMGWLKFLSPPGFTNQLTSWIRPANPSAPYYPNGFSNELIAVGSPYTIPTTNRVIDCTNALLILSGADFVDPLTNQMTLRANNTVVNVGPHNASMKIVPTNGTFTGSVIVATRTNTFQGVFLQQQNIGLGYFFGSNYVGEVRFEPALP